MGVLPKSMPYQLATVEMPDRLHLLPLKTRVVAKNHQMNQQVPSSPHGLHNQNGTILWSTVLISTGGGAIHKITPGIF